ncbi:MAG: cytochrome d ubiquinol oxidase subunit II [Bacteroidetes bacterium]|nr:MAG: cytochrome d ubiquinol oxidase subunit II [Bacteroidota bacterium]
MFETLSLLALQQYWWIIVSILAAILVFLMFVQGGQTMIYCLGKTDMERTILVNALGRKWEFTFTTLVTFGGAFFASFPLFYATSFGGAYWVWMLILFAFIIQAVAYEYRSRAGNFLGKKTYEGFLFVNGLLGTVLVGTAVATFFTGSPFRLNMMNQVEWETPYRGLELAFNFARYETFVNLSLGLAVFFLARVLAIQYFMKSVDEKNINARLKKKLIMNAAPFLVFFLFFVANLLLMRGYAVDPESKMVTMEAYKYLHNFLEMPVVLVIFILGVLIVLLGIIRPLMDYKKCHNKVLWHGGIGTFLTIFALFLVAGFNNTAFYPSYTDIQSSLTIENASSSHYTLTAMSYVSLMVPFVVAYIWYAWKAISNKKITAEEMEDEDTHIY